MQLLQQRLADVAAAGRVPKQAHAADAGGARRQPAGGRAPRPGRASAAGGGVSAEQASRASQDMEARTKMQEKRQEAKQRYKEKKKNRRYVLIYKAIIINYFSQLSSAHRLICHYSSV